MAMKFAAMAALSCSLALAACGDDDIGQSPVTQLRGQWMMTNRMENCDHSYVQFATNGIYRVFDQGPMKKYFEITKYTVAPGKVTLAVNATDPNADTGQSLVFNIDGDSLRLTDILANTGESYKTPADDTDPDIQKHMKTIFQLSVEHFTLDRCPVDTD